MIVTRYHIFQHWPASSVPHPPGVHLLPRPIEQLGQATRPRMSFGKSWVLACTLILRVEGIRRTEGCGARQVVVPGAEVVPLLIFLSGLAHMQPDADLEPLLGLVADTVLPLLPEMQPRVRTVPAESRNMGLKRSDSEPCESCEMREGGVRGCMDDQDGNAIALCHEGAIDGCVACEWSRFGACLAI